MHIDEHGHKIFVGQEAVDNFWSGVRRLRENRKLHYKTEFQGLPISIENRKGSIRKGVDPDGEEWETKHKRPYGYIPGTKGPDGDAVDVFVGPNADAAYAYVVHINKPDTGKYDEDKVMLGFDSEQDALRCFRQHYDEPNKFYSGMDIIPMWKFRDKVFVKKETSKKLVASRGGSPQVSTYDRGQQLLAPLAFAATFYPAVLGSLKTHEDMEAFPEYDSPDTIPTPLKKKRASEAGADVGGGDFHSEMFGKKGPYGDSLGTDQKMKKSILGHHQDIMVRPEVREGGPGSGPKALIKQAGGEYRGSMLHPTKGMTYLFDDPSSKHKSTLTMYEKDMTSPEAVKAHMDSKKKEFGEAEEHGVKGMKWGVRHARKDAAGQKHPTTGNTQHATNRSVVDHDRTLNQMTGDVAKGNAIAAKLNQRNQGKPQEPNAAHDQLRQTLAQLGWKAAGAVARLAGVGGAFEALQSIMRSPSGEKFAVKTDAKGEHSVAKAKTRKTKASIRESQSFEQRLGSFLREARRGKIYYARSLQRYGSGREARDIDDLREAYPDDNITWPRTRRHAELGMGHFHKKIDKSKEVVITGLHRRKITAGVASEARHALKNGIPVRFLRHGKLRTVEAIENIEGGRPGGHYARVIFKKHKKKR